MNPEKSPEHEDTSDDDSEVEDTPEDDHIEEEAEEEDARGDNPIDDEPKTKRGRPPTIHNAPKKAKYNRQAPAIARMGRVQKWAWRLL